MRTLLWVVIATLAWFLPEVGLAQEVTASKSEKWSLSGTLQFQWLHDFDLPAAGRRTNDGFRVRRSRFKAAGKVTSQVDAVFYIEVRDNSPRLKDGFGRIRLGDKLTLRFGQFKVPVWREEYQRSSGNLLLIERSAVAAYLVNRLLSARHVGVEAAIEAGKAEILLNLSNGAGEGLRETAGTRKNGVGVNNGKMLSGRLNLQLQRQLEFGISVVANRLGGDGADLNGDGIPETNRWRTAIAPDFLLTVPVGQQGGLDIEGGLFFASSQDGRAAAGGRLADLNAFGFDLSGRYNRKVAALEEFGGLDGIEFAAGVSFVDPNTDVSDDAQSVLRAGPGFLFGKNSRLQINAELLIPQAQNANTTFRLRAQTTFRF
jgi:hypothetical protein